MLKFTRIRSIRKFNELYKPGDAYSTIQPGIVTKLWTKKGLILAL